MKTLKQILGDSSHPVKRKNKRLSVWSVKNETEVFAISSSSETEGLSDDDSMSRPQPPSSKNHLKGTSAQVTSTLGRPRERREVSKQFPPTSKASGKGSASASSSKSRLPSKKRMKELLVDYAYDLYTSLNAVVFKNQLPPVNSTADDGPNVCEIIWSNTLKKTAGRAVISRYDINSSPCLLALPAYLFLILELLPPQELLLNKKYPLN